MKPFHYDYIGHHPEHIATIARWHQDEWQRLSPELTTQLRIELYSSYQSQQGVPSCILALNDIHVAGSASLVFSDMDTHAHLSPWLASVFVHPAFRNQGVATQLLKICADNAVQAGFKTLYLFTPDQKNFYLKRGWKLFESTEYRGEKVDIMSLELTANL